MDSQPRLDLALELVAQFQEKENRCAPLHERARNCWEQKQFDEAVRCCQESYRLGLELGDSYVRAAARFHHGLTLLVLKDRRYWDQAAAYCEESAVLLHGLGERAAEGVAWLTVGRIADAQIESGDDRTHRALHAYLQVSNPLAEGPDELVQAAERLYREAVNRAGQTKPRVAAPAPRQEPPSTEAAPPSSASTEPPPAQGEHAPASAPPPAPAAGTAAPPEGSAAQPVPSPEPAAVPKSVPIERRVEPISRPLPRMRQSLLMLLTITWIVMVGVMLFVLAVMGAQGFLSAHRETELVLAGGLAAAAALLITALDLVLMKRSGMLLFQNPRDCAAIVDAHGRIWSEDRAGIHFALPLLEKLEGFIPLVPQEWETMLKNLSREDGSFFSAHVKTRYRIVDARRVWNEINSAVPRAALLGEECPVPSERTERALHARVDAQMREIVGSALVQLANDPRQRESLVRNRELSAYIREALAPAAEGMWIYFYRVNVEVFLPFVIGGSRK